MNGHREPDPLDALRQIDPVADDQLPSASLARLRARVREDVMTTTTDRARRPSRPAVIVSGLVTAGAALAIVLFLGGRGAPAVLPDPSQGPVSASCIELYSLDTLADRDHAFDGTVTEIRGDRVTFEVNDAYLGAEGASVTLDAPGMTGNAITSAGGPNLERGKRYLVAGDATFVWSCGFTQPYDEDIARQWSAVLKG